MNKQQKHDIMLSIGIILIILSCIGYLISGLYLTYDITYMFVLYGLILPASTAIGIMLIKERNDVNSDYIK